MKVLLIMSIFVLGFVDSSSEEQRQSYLNHNTDLLLTSMRTDLKYYDKWLNHENKVHKYFGPVHSALHIRSYYNIPYQPNQILH